MKIKFKDVLYIKGRIGWQLLKKEEYLTKGDYYLITGVDIQDNHLIDFSQCYYVSKERYEMDDKIQVHEGDIIVTKDGTIGKIGFIDKLDKPATLNSHLFLIRNLRTDILDSKYLFYLLQSDFFKKYATNNTSGSNIPAFTQKNIESFEIELPPLEVQKQIANILGVFDAKINTNLAINSTFEEIISNLYCFWFENFNYPDGNGKAYRQNNGQLDYNAILKRDIPVGWKVVPMLNVCYWETNSQPPKSEFSYEPKDGYVRFIQNRDYDSNDHMTFIPKTKSLSIVNRFDILMDKYGDAGTVRYGIEGAFNVALAKIGVKKNNMQEYVRCFLSSKPVYEYLHNACMASTRASLSEENIKPLNVIVPPEWLLDKFETQAHLLRDSILKNKDENEKLVKMRDELLPLLMNGQISIK